MSMQEQEPQDNQFPWVRMYILIFAIIFGILGAYTVIGTIPSTSPGYIASVFSLIIGTIGVIVSLLGWFFPISSKWPNLFQALKKKSIIEPPKNTVYDIFRWQVEMKLASEPSKKALIVFADERFQGRYVEAALPDHSWSHKEIFLMRNVVNNKYICAAVFHLPTYNAYLIELDRVSSPYDFIKSSYYKAMEIKDGEIAVLDWRNMGYDYGPLPYSS